MHGLSFFCIFTNIFEPTWATIIAIFNFHEKKKSQKGSQGYDSRAA